MANAWRSRALFVSSTFSDMHGERDLLRDKVLPHVGEVIRPFQETLEAIDLRWGVGHAVDDEAAREAEVLRVCLDEIDRSRPLFLLFLGDRYGWVPPQHQLERIGRERNFASPITMPSLTAIEVLYAALASKSAIQPLFYLRRPLPYDQLALDVAGRYSERHGTTPNPRAARQLAQLKALLRARFPGSVRDYTAWDPVASGFRFDELESMLIEDLKNLLGHSDNRPRAPRTWKRQEREVLDELQFKESRAFVGRESVLARLDELATSDAGPSALCLQGEAGSGKTAMVSKLVADLRAKGIFVLFHAAGASARSPRVSTVMARWIAELASALHVEVPAEASASLGHMAEMLQKLLAELAGRQRVVCVLDGLDQLEATDVARRTSWLPRNLPRGVRCIATAQPGERHSHFCYWLGAESMLIPPFSRAEAESAVRLRCQLRRQFLDATVTAAIVDRVGARPDHRASESPLWLVNALDEISSLGSREFAPLLDQRTEPTVALGAMLAQVARSLPPDVPALYERLVDRASQLFGEALVSGVLELIAISRAGLRESDFAAVLCPSAGDSWSALQFAQVRRYLSMHLLQRNDGHWDFAHLQFREFVLTRLEGPAGRGLALHAALAAHLLTLPGDDPLKCSEVVHHSLCAGLLDETASYLTAERSATEEEGVLATLAEVGTEQIERVEDVLGSWPFAIFEHVCARLDSLGCEPSVTGPEYAALAKLLELYGAPLATAFRREADSEAYQHLLEALVERGDALVRRHRELAREQREKGSESIGLYDRIALLSPFVALVSTLVELRLRSGDHAGALELQKRALELRRLDAAYSNLEEIGAETAQRDKLPFARGSSVLGGGELLYNDFVLFGDMARGIGRVREAKEYFEKAVQVAIGCGEQFAVAHAQASCRLAEVLFELGEGDKARQNCKLAETMVQRGSKRDESAVVLCRIYDLLTEYASTRDEVAALMPAYESAHQEASAAGRLSLRDELGYGRALFAVGRAELGVERLVTCTARATERTLLDPADPATLTASSRAILEAARVACQVEQTVLGRELLAKGLELIEHGLAQWPDNIELQRHRAHAFDVSGRLFDEDDEWEARIDSLERSRGVLEARREATPENLDVLLPLLDIYLELFSACGYRRGAARSIYLCLFNRLGVELLGMGALLSGVPKRAAMMEKILRDRPIELDRMEETGLTLDLTLELLSFSHLLSEVAKELSRSDDPADRRAIDALTKVVGEGEGLDEMFGGMLAAVARSTRRASHPGRLDAYFPPVRGLAVYLLFGGTELTATISREMHSEYLGRLLDAARRRLDDGSFAEPARLRMLEVLTALEEALRVVRVGGTTPWRFPYYLSAYRLGEDGKPRSQPFFAKPPSPCGPPQPATGPPAAEARPSGFFSRLFSKRKSS